MSTTAPEVETEPVVYWGIKQIGEYLGIKQDSVHNLTLPREDVSIGDRRGWRPEKIIEWNQGRPGRGRWGTR